MITLKNQAAADVIYTIYRAAGDRATYTGPLNTDITSDQLVLTSKAPKRNGLNLGNRRSSANLITSTSVLDSESNVVIRNRKFAIDASLPVGTSLIDVQEDAARIIAFLSVEANLVEFLQNGKIEL